jgi:hypothetical protein
MMLVKNSLRLARIVLVMSAGIAIVANVLSIAKALSTDASFDLGAAAVSIAFGVGAPVIALAAGKQFVNIHNAERKALNELQEIYRDECQAYDKKKLAAFNKHQKELSVRSVRMDADNGQASSQGYNRTSDAKEVVRSHLEANPEDFALSVRDLASKLGVGKSTVADARREMQPSSNGHH